MYNSRRGSLGSNLAGTLLSKTFKVREEFKSTRVNLTF